MVGAAQDVRGRVRALPDDELVGVAVDDEAAVAVLDDLAVGALAQDGAVADDEVVGALARGLDAAPAGRAVDADLAQARVEVGVLVAGARDRVALVAVDVLVLLAEPDDERPSVGPASADLLAVEEGYGALLKALLLGGGLLGALLDGVPSACDRASSFWCRGLARRSAETASIRLVLRSYLSTVWRASSTAPRR